MILNIFKVLSTSIVPFEISKKRRNTRNDSIQVSLHFQVSRVDISFLYRQKDRPRTECKNGQTISPYLKEIVQREYKKGA